MVVGFFLQCAFDASCLLFEVVLCGFVVDQGVESFELSFLELNAIKLGAVLSAQGNSQGNQ